MKKLSTPDSHHLKAAEGWLELGNYLEANEELENIKPEMRAHPAVLAMRYKIYAKAKKWNMAAEIAGALTRLLPEKPDVWIAFAYSTRRKTDNGISLAKEILLEAEPKFPREFIFPYNLACYCSQLDQLEEAQTWFKKAMALDEKKVRQLALTDPDLKPLWDSMGGTLWKRAG